MNRPKLEAAREPLSSVKSFRESENESVPALYTIKFPSGMAARITPPPGAAARVVLIWTSFLYGPRLGSGVAVPDVRSIRSIVCTGPATRDAARMLREETAIDLG